MKLFSNCNSFQPTFCQVRPATTIHPLYKLLYNNMNGKLQLVNSIENSLLLQKYYNLTTHFVLYLMTVLLIPFFPHFFLASPSLLLWFSGLVGVSRQDQRAIAMKHWWICGWPLYTGMEIDCSLFLSLPLCITIWSILAILLFVSRSCLLVIDLSNIEFYDCGLCIFQVLPIDPVSSFV